MEALDSIVRRVKERARRARLHRQIAAIEKKLDKVGPNPQFLLRDRAYRLMSKLKRLQRELAQPELFI